jgi:hypothetical protein
MLRVWFSVMYNLYRPRVISWCTKFLYNILYVTFIIIWNNYCLTVSNLVTTYGLNVSTFLSTTISPDTTALSSSFVLHWINLWFTTCTISCLLQHMSALAIHTQLWLNSDWASQELHNYFPFMGIVILEASHWFIVIFDCQHELGGSWTI